MPVTTGDIIQITASMLFGGSDLMQNVYYVEGQTGTEITDAEFVDGIRPVMEDIYDHLVPQLVTDVTFQTIGLYHVTDDRPLGVYSWPLLTAGTGQGDPLPTQVAFQVNFATGVKRSQGRKYIGGFGEGAQSAGGHVGSPVVTVLEAYGGEVCTSVSISGLFFAFGHISAADSNFVEWLQVQVPGVVATQRRRKQGTGA